MRLAGNGLSAERVRTSTRRLKLALGEDVIDLRKGRGTSSLER